MGETAGILTF